MTTMIRRSMMVVAAVLVMAAVNAQAQDLIAKVYVVPRAGTGARFDAFHSKYVRDLQPAAWFGDLNYGMSDAYFVCMFATAEQHLSLASNLDVIALPVLTDRVSPTALTTFQSKMEGLKIPMDALTTNNTWHDAADLMAGMFFYAARFEGLQQAGHRVSWLATDIQLDDTAGTLTADQVTALEAVSTSFGLNVPALTGQMRVRDYLRAFNTARRDSGIIIWMLSEGF